MEKKRMTPEMQQRLIAAAKNIDSGCGEPEVYFTPIKVRVKGPMALFSRPEMRVDKWSYPVPTFAALRNIMQTVYWHDGVQFIPAECIVVNPIRYDRDVVTKGVKSVKKPRVTEDHVVAGARSEVTLRTTKYLYDVEYIVTSYILSRPDKMNPNDTLQKFYAKTMKNLEKGGVKHPYLGARECGGDMEAVTEEEVEAARILAKQNNGGEVELGLMTMDFDYTEHNQNPAKPTKPIYINAVMKDGVINFMDCEVFRSC